MSDIIINGIEPCSFSDYPNHISLVVFTSGCNLRCPYCHNKDLWKMKQKSDYSTSDVVHILKTNFIIDSLVISGGECTLQFNLLRFIKKIKHEVPNILIKVDTNGINYNIVNKLVKHVDFIAMDVKSPIDKYNQTTNSYVNICDVKRSIEIIKSSGIPHQFRTTMWNLSDGDIEDLQCEFGIQVKKQAYIRPV